MMELRTLSVVVAVAWARLPEHQCRHGAPWGTTSTTEKKGWLDDVWLQERAKDKASRYVIPNTEVVDLDLPAEERWVEIGLKYANESYKIKEYFEQYLPDYVIEALVEVAEEVVANYSGFGEYAAEMRGYALGLNVSLGYVVMANLVYQLEHIGTTCDNWNTTGPTGECWYSRERKDPGPDGLCTSLVADDAENKMIHGRNLDWSLPQDIRDLVIDVQFTRSGTLVYTGTTIVSFVGILNAMRPGQFSYSFDARCQGGHLLVNLLQALKTGAATPSQHARAIFDASDDYGDFDALIDAFSDGDLIDDAYYILGGVSDQDAAVVTRGRYGAVDVWRLNSSAWFLLETNYDHWLPAPAADDRRDPGYDHMNALGQANLNETALFDQVLSVWPTFNLHTDISCVMSAAYDIYSCRVWNDDSLSSSPKESSHRENRASPLTTAFA